MLHTKPHPSVTPPSITPTHPSLGCNLAQLDDDVPIQVTVWVEESLLKHPHNRLQDAVLIPDRYGNLAQQQYDAFSNTTALPDRRVGGGNGTVHYAKYHLLPTLILH